MQRHLNKMGIYTIGDLAKTPLTKLTKRLGVNGQVLWQCANLIDNSPFSPHSYRDHKAIGCGLTLPRDYYYEDEIFTVLLENCSTVCRRARQQGYMGQVIHVSCKGADWDAPTGFSRQLRLPETTNLPMEIFEYAKKLFLQHWDGLPTRRIGVSLSELKRDDMIQLTLFQDRYKQMKIEKTMDLIKDRFGETSILRASSLIPAGQAKNRRTLYVDPLGLLRSL